MLHVLWEKKNKRVLLEFSTVGMINRILIDRNWKKKHIKSKKSNVVIIVRRIYVVLALTLRK